MRINVGGGWRSVTYRLVPLPVVASTAAATAADDSMSFRTLVTGYVVEPFGGSRKGWSAVRDGGTG